MAVKVKNAAESQMINQVIRETYAFAELFRINTGCVRTEAGYLFSTGTPKGFPDLAGYRRSDGRAVYIECKVAPNKPTEEQLKFIKKAQDSGCIAAVCYSVDEAKSVILGTN